MEKEELKNVDSEDINDLLVKIENSFGIKFDDNEFSKVITFGEMCDIIVNKFELENSESCTTQQAFYKLRESILEVFNIQNVTPETLLAEILPRKNRVANTQKLDKNLDFKTNILEPKKIISWTLIIIFLSSFVGLFFDWKLGSIVNIISLISFRIAKIYGKELNIKTVGQLAEKIARENYIKSRRNPQTFNRKEIEKILIEWFSEYLDIEKSELNREATFV